jgi:hypothetical protein
MKTELQKLEGIVGRSNRSRRHSVVICSLLGFVVGILAGCRPETLRQEAISAGSYALVTVDGNKVPCTLTHEGHALTVESGTFIINPEGSCSSKVTFSMPSGVRSSREVKASYTRQGSKLIMKWEGAGTTSGTIAGDKFTMNNEGMIFAYQK